MSNPESVDAINAASEILNGEVEKSYDVRLPYNAIKVIYDRLDISVSLDNAMIEVLNYKGPAIFADGPVAGSEESVTAILFKRFSGLMNLIDEIYGDTRVSDENVEGVVLSCSLTESEVDFLNEALHSSKKNRMTEDLSDCLERMRREAEDPDAPVRTLEQIHNEKRIEEALQFSRELTLSWMQEMLPVFKDLNLGFIEAGGEPRPRFLSTYEGPLPEKRVE